MSNLRDYKQNKSSSPPLRYMALQPLLNMVKVAALGLGQGGSEDDLAHEVAADILAQSGSEGDHPFGRPSEDKNVEVVRSQSSFDGEGLFEALFSSTPPPRSSCTMGDPPPPLTPPSISSASVEALLVGMNPSQQHAL